MAKANHPPKQAIRDYLDRRKQQHKPPPTPEEIRRQLGWGLVLRDGKDRRER